MLDNHGGGTNVKLILDCSDSWAAALSDALDSRLFVTLTRSIPIGRVQYRELQ